MNSSLDNYSIVVEIMDEIIDNVISKVGENCPICFENLSNNKNKCFTPCGHVFCFECMVKTLNTSNTCPYCRFKINDKPINNLDMEEYNDDDDYDDDDDDDDDEDYYDDEGEDDVNNEDNNTNIQEEGHQPSEETNDDECNIEYFESYFKDKGISYLNLLSVLFNRYPQGMTRRMKRKMENNVYDIAEFLDEEHMKQKEEINIMLQNDGLNFSNI